MPKAVQYTQQVLATTTLLVAGGSKRTAIILSSPKVANVYVSIANQQAVVGTGIKLAPATRPVILTRDILGDMIDMGMSAISDGGTETISWVETTL